MVNEKLLSHLSTIERMLGKILGIADSTLQRRLSSGWSVEDAFTRPIQRHRKMDGDGNG